MRGASDRPADVTHYSEEQRDLADALAPLYDQLVINRAKWWALEKRVAANVVSHEEDVRAAPEPGPRAHDPAARRRGADGRSDGDGAGPSAAQRAVGKGARTSHGASAHGVPGRRKTPPYVPKALLKGLTLDKVDPALIEWVD